MPAKYKGSAARKAPDPLSLDVDAIKKSVALYKSLGLGPETMVTPSQLFILHSTNRLPATAPKDEPAKSLEEVVASRIKLYEHEHDKLFPYDALDRYDWPRPDSRPELRIVPKEDEDSWDEYEPRTFDKRQAADVQVEDLSDVVSKGRLTKDIAQYLKEIGGYRLLTSEEVTELSRRIRQGDIESRKKLVMHNLKLVVSIAKGYQHRGSSLMDLIQSGGVGLLTAVEKFEAERGHRFSTYASWWIKQAIGREIIEHRNDVRVPAYLQEETSKVNKFNRLYLATHNRLPGPDEIQEELGWEPKHLKLVLKARGISYTRMDCLTSGLREEPTQLIDKKADSVEDRVELGEEYSKARVVLDATLSEREIFILEQRREGKTLDAVGRMIGLTRERVRQIQYFATVRLNRALGNNGPDPDDVKSEKNERRREYNRKKREANKFTRKNKE